VDSWTFHDIYLNRGYDPPDAVERAIPGQEARVLMAEFDLAKIEIEGGESEIPQDRRLATCGPRAIVLEYHAARCPEADPRRAVQALLHGGGYRTLNGAAPDSTAAQGILWALRDGDAPPPDGPEPGASDGPAQDDAGG
jgi:hypothetical protein